MTAMTLFKGNTNLPAYLKDVEMDETTKALMGGASISTFKRISIKGNVFRMIANGKEVATNEDRGMNVVIVAAAPAVSRTYYEGSYQEGAAISPACWSNDGVKPDDKVTNPQCGTCAKCPQNISGSGQGESRACRYSQRLAVVLEGDIEGNVYGLTLPATSIFGKGEENKLPLQAYVKFIATHGLPVTTVVTEMRFDTKSPVPKLTFKAVRPLDDEEYEIAKRQGETADAKAAITLTVAQQDKAKAKDNDGEEEEFEKPVAKKAAAPVEEDEPVKVSKKPVSADSDDVNDILNEWSKKK